MLVNRVDPCYLYRSEAVIDQTLPIDVFEFVLKKLSDINGARSVSRYWYAATLLTTKNFQNACLEKLNGIIPLHLKVGKTSSCNTFLELREAMLNTREGLVDGLKSLSDDELDELELLEPPMFFGYTFKLTKICKAIDKANTGEDFFECSSDLACMLMMKKATEVAKKTEDTVWRQLSFTTIALILGSNGKFERAREIELTEMIPGDDQTNSAISSTAKAMSRAGQILEAKKHEENIQSSDKKTYLLEIIEVMDLCKQGKFIEAEALTDTYEEFKKSDAYTEISHAYYNAGLWEECIKIADAIPIKLIRHNCLNTVLNKCQDAGDKAKAAQLKELLNKYKNGGL